mmetsp:Transcript_20378/g.36963  ORF Transcript_20378/g.36963 Transcript_20378/m.36963 type:complete len:182 (+) Transcript_20378:105-650(+)|eukprot:CAMPEP_0202480356 /NCGR_PEP_ID=MMETSP1361-20130828/380_1 /ASSEMBLY_ACC=CAM_ASM_000849 /TAXON_ID=210615 /ORGANISM="Staurosira complex sp., Strain CCMP2646" /LENGTH=181 /DNA_ID=CAMNT_0049107781 /DNA_START=72 /DNA_END=617 /DNA_ORIENTATION=-
MPMSSKNTVVATIAIAAVAGVAVVAYKNKKGTATSDENAADEEEKEAALSFKERIVAASNSFSSSITIAASKVRRSFKSNKVTPASAKTEETIDTKEQETVFVQESESKERRSKKTKDPSTAVFQEEKKDDVGDIDDVAPSTPSRKDKTAYSEPARPPSPDFASVFKKDKLDSRSVATHAA